MRSTQKYKVSRIFIFFLFIIIFFLLRWVAAKWSIKCGLGKRKLVQGQVLNVISFNQTTHLKHVHTSVWVWVRVYVCVLLNRDFVMVINPAVQPVWSIDATNTCTHAYVDISFWASIINSRRSEAISAELKSTIRC